MTYKYFLLSCGLSVHSVDGVLWGTRVLNFLWSLIYLFFPLTCALVSDSRNHCQIQCHVAFPIYFLLIFMVLALMFRSLTYFVSVFACGVTWGFSFILLHVGFQFSQHKLLKRLLLPHWMVLTVLLKITWPYMWGFISGLPVWFHWSMCLSLWQ